MVTLSIAAILMVIAVPSFETYRRNAELTAATNTLLSAMNAARGEAMKRGMSAMVVPAVVANNQFNLNNWNSGWVVFIDNDGSQDFTAADTLVSSQAPLPVYMNIVGNNDAGLSVKPYIMFDASGYSKRRSGGFGALALTLRRTDLDVAGVPPSDQVRQLIISSTGRARTCRPSSVSDATCAATLTQ